VTVEDEGVMVKGGRSDSDVRVSADHERRYVYLTDDSDDECVYFAADKLVEVLQAIIKVLGPEVVRRHLRNRVPQ
jgi:hypothetical protein